MTEIFPHRFKFKTFGTFSSRQMHFKYWLRRTEVLIMNLNTGNIQNRHSCISLLSLFKRFSSPPAVHSVSTRWAKIQLINAITPLMWIWLKGGPNLYCSTVVTRAHTLTAMERRIWRGVGGVGQGVETCELRTQILWCVQQNAVSVSKYATAAKSLAKGRLCHRGKK